MIIFLNHYYYTIMVLETVGSVEDALILAPAAWWRRCCDEGGRRRGALAREAVKCASGVPSPRSTPSNSSRHSEAVLVVLLIPLLFPTSLTSRFRLDIIEWLPAFLSPLPLPLPVAVNDDDDDDDVKVDDNVDRPFLAVSIVGKWSGKIRNYISSYIHAK